MRTTYRCSVPAAGIGGSGARGLFELDHCRKAAAAPGPWLVNGQPRADCRPPNLSYNSVVLGARQGCQQRSGTTRVAIAVAAFAASS
jgi:hypothetical protein